MRLPHFLSARAGSLLAETTKLSTTAARRLGIFRRLERTASSLRAHTRRGHSVTAGLAQEQIGDRAVGFELLD